jgi:hypothetical protein
MQEPGSEFKHQYCLIRTIITPPDSSDTDFETTVPF